MRLSRWTLLWLLIVGVLVAIEVSVLTGVLSLSNILGFFVIFVFGLVVIAVLAIVGGVFLGMWASHSILSTQGFTPFEQEMLRMRQDLKQVVERLDTIAERVGAANPVERKGP